MKQAKKCETGTWPALRRDYERLAGGKASILRMFSRFFTDVSFRTVCLYRLGHACRKRGLNVPGALIERLIHAWCHCLIGTACQIGPGFIVRHVGGVVIGSGVRMGADCEVRQGVTLGGNAGRRSEDGRTQPTLEDGVSLGAGAKVLGPITVGARSIVGANAVLLTDVPPDSVAVGVPARVVRRGSRKVPLPEQDGELAELLREILRRLSRLESQLTPPVEEPPG